MKRKQKILQAIDAKIENFAERSKDNSRQRQSGAISIERAENLASAETWEVATFQLKALREEVEALLDS